MAETPDAQSLYSCADVGLLRIGTLPDTFGAELQDGIPDAELIRRAVGDPTFDEAVRLASTALGHTLAKIALGDSVSSKKMRRARGALAGYQLRARSRATPFGIFAGVAVAHFAESADVVWGKSGVKFAKADSQWFGPLLSRLEADVTVQRVLRVIVNDLTTARDGRLVVLYHPKKDSGDWNAHELTLRKTVAVRRVLEAARYPVSFTELEQLLAHAYPDIIPDRVTALLSSLVECGALLTELRPPVGAAGDPVQHVLNCLLDVREQLSDDAQAIVTGLEQVQRGLEQYARASTEEAVPALTSVTERMRQIHEADRLVHVDLGLDVEVALPESVRSDIESVAATMNAVSAGIPPRSEMRQYHEDFVERYGLGRPVPVLELLNPDVGLGAPAGYQMPRSHRPWPPTRAGAGARVDVLLAIAQEAAFHRRREVVLDADMLRELTGQADPYPSFDIVAEMLARSVTDLNDGNYRLVVVGGQAVAGAHAGRFAELLGERVEPIRRFVRHLPTAAAGAVRAQLNFPAVNAHAANVSAVTEWSDHQLSLATFTDRRQPNALTLDDLSVVAEHDRLAVVSGRLGREVVPSVASMLTTAVHAPNAARLLDDLAYSYGSAWPAWRWWSAEDLPYLPRVRQGRVVLSSARWKPRDTFVSDITLDETQWRRQFDRWRDRWDLPQFVQVAIHDRRITVDLERGDHVRLIRRELAKNDAAHLRELPAGGEFGNAWLRTPDEVAGHTNEVVFSLARRAPTSRPPATPAAHSPARSGPYPPGSSWIYAKVYTSADRHNAVLRTEVPNLLRSMDRHIDGWFYIRYRDPEPHLRLRFRSRQPASSQTLGILHDWFAGLVAKGITARLTLDTYDPEIERYGGGAAAAAAERLFQADSEACRIQLGLLDQRILRLDRVVLAAANYVDIIHRMLGSEHAQAWMRDNSDSILWAQQPQSMKAQARQVIEPGNDWQALRSMPGGPEVAATWQRRGDAIAPFVAALTTPADVLPSILHMHHNRLIGIDTESEKRSLSLLYAGGTRHGR